MKKLKSIVISAQEGEAYWQPGVKGNCTTFKVSPQNVEKTQHTVFLHELPKNGEVPEHAHEIDEEIFICLEGEGIVTIDGQAFPFKKHDVVFLAPLSLHSIRTTSEESLKFMVVVSPAGLEERLKLMGKRRIDSHETPPESFESAIGKSTSHGVI